MNPLHITVDVVLGAVAVVCLVVELGSCLVLLRQRSDPDGRPLLVGLLAAIGTHLSVFGMTDGAWAPLLCVLPYAVVVALCLPRTWQPPPRRARLARAALGELAAPPELPEVLESDQIRWTSSAGDVAVRPVSDTEDTEQAPLSASEQEAWDSLRRSLGDS